MISGNSQTAIQVNYQMKCCCPRHYLGFGILGQVWYLIVSIPDLCTLTYFVIQDSKQIVLFEAIIRLCYPRQYFSKQGYNHALLSKAMNRLFYPSKAIIRTCYLRQQSNIFQSKVILMACYLIKPVHEISNNLLCDTNNASDQPAHTCSLIRLFASRLSIL